MSLPAGRRRIARTCRSASSHLSKPAPRNRPSTAYARRPVHVAATYSFLGRRLDAHWQVVTRTRVAMWLEQPASFFSRSDDTAVACFFSPRCRAVTHAASCGTQRASFLKAHVSTSQSDGADLSPANLSCPGVWCIAPVWPCLSPFQKGTRKCSNRQIPHHVGRHCQRSSWPCSAIAALASLASWSDVLLIDLCATLGRRLDWT